LPPQSQPEKETPFPRRTGAALQFPGQGTGFPRFAGNRSGEIGPGVLPPARQQPRPVILQRVKRIVPAVVIKDIPAQAVKQRGVYAEGRMGPQVPGWKSAKCRHAGQNKKARQNRAEFGWLIGLEPTTFGTTIRRSNLLSYNHRVWACKDKNFSANPGSAFRKKFQFTYSMREGCRPQPVSQPFRSVAGP